MCGRYLLTATPDEIARFFRDAGIDIELRENFPPRYNIAPSQPILIMRNGETRKREAALVSWGFLPSWTKFENSRPQMRPMNNARSETAAEKPSFRAAMRRRRCLIPASGFYEWRGEAGARQPYWIRPAAGGVFAFAGLWEALMTRDGSELESAAILTTGAGPDLRPIHHREPVVIAPGQFALWLDADERDLDRIAPLLAPREAGWWIADPVSPDVNSPANDGPGLIAPLGGPVFKTDLFE
ncbi:MAG: SOS response-associated peptidase [Pseudomonadota bacterium]